MIDSIAMVKFCCRTVPQLVAEVPPARPDMTKEESIARRMAMTRSLAEKLVQDKRSLAKMPVGFDHKQAVVGKAPRAYIYDNALYHIGEIDESTLLGKQVAGHLRRGEITQVSLTHVPDNPELGVKAANIELSLCTLEGARPGSGVIRIWDDDVDKVPADSLLSEEEEDPEVESFERERLWYLGQLVAASLELATQAVVPEFEHPDRHVTVAMSSSSAAEPSAPPPSIPAPKTPSMGELLEERMEKFEKHGVRPEDAKEDDTYEVYLMRAFESSPNVISNALRERWMRMMVSLAKARMDAEEQARSMSSLSESIVKKHGVRANPPFTVDEWREAERQRDTPRLEKMRDQLLMVQASEEKAGEREDLERRERLLKEERELLTQRAAFLKEEKDREAMHLARLEEERNVQRRGEYTEQLRQMQQPRRPPPVTPQQLARDAQAYREGAFHKPDAPAPDDPVAMAQQRKNQRSLRDTQRVLYNALRDDDMESLRGFSADEIKELKRRFAMEGEMQEVRSTADYLQMKQMAPDAMKPEAGMAFRAPYISGMMVSASRESVEQYYRAQGRPEMAARLDNDFNRNLDKAAAPVLYGERQLGLNDPMQVGQFLRSTHTLIDCVRDRQRGMVDMGNHGFRRPGPSGGAVVNGWRNANSSLQRGLAISGTLSSSRMDSRW